MAPLSSLSVHNFAICRLPPPPLLLLSRFPPPPPFFWAPRIWFDVDFIIVRCRQLSMVDYNLWFHKNQLFLCWRIPGAAVLAWLSQDGAFVSLSAHQVRRFEFPAALRSLHCLACRCILSPIVLLSFSCPCFLIKKQSSRLLSSYSEPWRDTASRYPAILVPLSFTLKQSLAKLLRLPFNL